MAAIALWIITCFDNNGSYFTQKVVGVLCTVGTLFMMLFAGKDKVKRLLTPPAFALFAYMLLSGVSTLYARSRKFAIAEFAVFLAAFAVYLCIVLFRMTAGPPSAEQRPRSLPRRLRSVCCPSTQPPAIC